MNRFIDRRWLVGRGLGGLLVVGVLVTGTPSSADAGWWIVDTTKEAAITGGRAARDGALTFGRATKAFFTRGPSAAKQAWQENAARTKANAKAGGAATKAAATED